MYYTQKIHLSPITRIRYYCQRAFFFRNQSFYVYSIGFCVGIEYATFSVVSLHDETSTGTVRSRSAGIFEILVFVCITLNKTLVLCNSYEINTGYEKKKENETPVLSIEMCLSQPHNVYQLHAFSVYKRVFNCKSYGFQIYIWIVKFRDYNNVSKIQIHR